MNNAQRPTLPADTERTCQTCNTTFLANTPRHIYCSDNCRVKAHHNKKRETKLAAEKLRVRSKTWRTTLPVAAPAPMSLQPYQLVPPTLSAMPPPVAAAPHNSLQQAQGKHVWEVRQLEDDLAYLQEGYHWPQTCLWLGATTGLLFGLLIGKRQPMSGQIIVRIIGFALLLGIIGWAGGYYIGRWTLSVDSYRQQQVKQIQTKIAFMKPLSV